MMKKIKAMLLRYWISVQNNWAKAEEMHQKIEAQKIENQLRYQNGGFKKY